MLAKRIIPCLDIKNGRTVKGINFLSLADELNEKVSRYFNGSNASEDVRAYDMVREADKKFVDGLNDLEDERYEYGLNYELAESFLDGFNF